MPRWGISRTGDDRIVLRCYEHGSLSAREEFTPEEAKQLALELLEEAEPLECEAHKAVRSTAWERILRTTTSEFWPSP
jgi:hypothetical protein